MAKSTQAQQAQQAQSRESIELSAAMAAADPANRSNFPFCGGDRNDDGSEVPTGPAAPALGCLAISGASFLSETIVTGVAATICSFTSGVR